MRIRCFGYGVSSLVFLLGLTGCSGDTSEPPPAPAPSASPADPNAVPPGMEPADPSLAQPKPKKK